jgi:hypothetical protein
MAYGAGPSSLTLRRNLALQASAAALARPQGRYGGLSRPYGAHRHPKQKVGPRWFGFKPDCGRDVTFWPTAAQNDVHSNVGYWGLKRTRSAHFEFCRVWPDLDVGGDPRSGFLEYARAITDSLRLDLRLANDATPFLVLFMKKGSKVGSAHLRGIKAKGHKLALDVG